MPEVLIRTIQFAGVQFTLLDVGLLFLLPVLSIGLVLWLLALGLRRLVRTFQMREETQTLVRRWIRGVARFGWLVTIVASAAGLLGADLGTWAGTVFRVLNQPFFTSGNTNISVITLIMVIPVFYLAGWAARMARRMLEHGVLAGMSLDPARRFTLLSIVRFTVTALIAVLGLSVIGINLSSLAVIFGVLGIGLGFGLQNVVGNMFAGAVILFTRPIKEGDRVLVDDIEGTVKSIKLIHTIVTTITHETIIIPNAKITDNSTHNYSYDRPEIIVCNSVQVAYSSDLDDVGRILLEVAERNPFAVPGKPARYLVWSFDSSGITVRLCTWIKNAEQRIDALGWTNLEIWRAFRAGGVTIPFPQLDLHLPKRSDADPEESDDPLSGEDWQPRVH